MVNRGEEGVKDKGNGKGSTERILEKKKVTRRSIVKDPILCRLRLNDQFGNPIEDAQTFFRDCKVVGFFFGTIWKQQKSSFEGNVLEFCRRNPHRFKCIFISVDSSRKDFDQVVRDKPWIHMIWEDGSNEEENDASTKPKEQFLTPEDDALLKAILKDSVRYEDDSRPISRVGLCHLLNVFYSPTLKIYHLESKEWLDSKVRPETLNSDDNKQRAWEKWEKGGKTEMSFSEIFYSLRYLLIGILLAIGYFILISFDESYKIVNLVEHYLNQNHMKGQGGEVKEVNLMDHKKVVNQRVDDSLGGGSKGGHQYVEF
ncbi:hypothetical protein BY996DRAFT_4582733 [Phakopsora pachyrhizi]|uniref:Thioredoxin-like fold domain-containing protein n=1 Tax=Phakopsora pachyrhizi TaxID=170000 RepID=A0AAV0B7K0_PHAPC|nr:hypothetical protein BY996DRAFT_4595784 [Phakopsora pachyrhizi]KAI8453759.1 hypothetical protein BY996DRAFT_4582733 [Phakopsora pachyrhizi]CAH7677475.1 hypothetical protein PPACK8108_LOCUS12630 [Phakopsora pachyrhizi]CAH7681655.1 hypothetical protein PPACK8108_LOCUS14284 [Phakopsora pachyrhizi]